MAIVYLLDTNIFLEILLNQKKSADSKKFLRSNLTKVYISDFSLHSIGVILFRHKKIDVFNSFVEDLISKVQVLNLPNSEYIQMTSSSKTLKLDFDDLYQYQIAKYFDLKIVTLDKDFKKVKDLDVIFI